MGDSLLTSFITVFAALTAVGLSHLISAYHNFTRAKYGLIDEIESNNDSISLIKTLIDDIEKTVRGDPKNISDFLNVIPPQTNNSSYKYFSQQGYLLKVKKEIKEELNFIYFNFTLINNTINLYKMMETEKQVIAAATFLETRIQEIEKSVTPDFLKSIQEIGFFK